MSVAERNEYIHYEQENAKINAVVDMLIESDSDFSNILGKEGLIKQ